MLVALERFKKKQQESCIINGGKTTKYFKLERGARQGDPIPAPADIYLLKVNNRNTRISCEIILNIFHTLLSCSYC